MIKVLQQRSRLEQSKPEKQGLRSARSVPSINIATGGMESKGELLPLLHAELRNLESLISHAIL